MPAKNTRAVVRAWLTLALLLAFAFSCASSRRNTTGEDAIATLDELAAHEPSVRAILAPREDAFVRARDDASEDPESRGRIVSEGWRATATKRFDTLGVRLPESAEGTTNVGASRFAALHLRVTLEGARADSVPHLDRGRVVYPLALESSDRVFAATDTRLEEFLVLRDARAPRALTWNMQLPEGLARVVERDGAFLFEDARGQPKLVMAAPVAYDAHGARIALTAAWDETRHALTVTLPQHDVLAYPVVVDPIYDVSVWFDAGRRVPAGRYGHALAFDSGRGEVVLFGGAIAGGDLNDTWVWSGTTSSWTQRTPTSPPPPRYGHALAFDSARGEVVLFGGLAYSVFFNDTWVWNGATSSWTQRSPVSSPSPRYGHALAFDAPRGEIVLFGGDGPGGRPNDTWVWSGATSSWTQRSPASPPPARIAHALAFDSARAEVVLFGGLGSTDLLNDTWVWNGATSSWTPRAPISSPSARYFHALAEGSARGEIFLFGGADSTGRRSDTWVWSGATSSWTQRSPTSPPSARTRHALAFDSARGEIVLFGGTGTGLNYFNDTWVWSGATSSWTQRSPIPPPPARYDHALAFDSARGEIVMFGGSDNPKLNDTWVWRGAASSWTQRSPVSPPPARSGHALAFDNARGEVVLFGGAGITETLNDTWVWSGAVSSWTQRSPASPPPARSGHALAFDSARAEVVLFGGAGNAGSFNDTWAWSGATSSWAERSPASPPPPRYGHALAFDSARAEVVLFGGTGYTGSLNDTWVWRGATSSWAQASPSSLPPARYGPALAFDSTRGEVVLFGGLGAGATQLNDTWVWSGATSSWLQRSPSSPPPARWRHALAFDSARGEIVVFGGRRGGPDLNDSWVHRTLGGTCITSADCLETSFCVDGLCCNAASCGMCATCAGTSPGRCAPVTNTEDPDTCANASGKSCSNLGECKTALGEAATTPADCVSGFLVDGVCCSTAKCDACQTCDVSKTERGLHPGQCDYVRERTDPKGDCADDGTASCKRDGTCDGRGACRVYDRGAACGNNVCVRNAASGQFCTGAGDCSAVVAALDCGAYACANGACPDRCASNTECTALHHCESGACTADRGAACDGDHTVTSPEGGRVDCAPYHCAGATCNMNCTSKADCTGEADCTADGKCVPFTTRVTSSSGEGCRAAATDASTSPVAWGALLLWVLVRTRRQHAVFS